ncbi:MAG: FAD:protein FMN transferase [Clostridiaceae bacterium]|jgi:thiamine biosynthesis lipoprotein|nr:FAD:protein FMN transferase [Clostridiaceae bacterium]
MNKKSGVKVALLLTAFLSIALLAGCNPPEQYFVFGTFLEIDLSGTSAKTESEIVERLNKTDGLMSATIAGGDIYRINKAAAGEAVSVSAETTALLLLCRELYDLTDGAFNPALRPITALWGFTPETFTLPGSVRVPPDAAVIEEALPLCGFSAEDFTIDKNANTVTKRLSGAELDLGAIAKGYAAEQAAAIAAKASKNASGIINLGGNIFAVGGAQNIGIGNPRTSSLPYFGSLPVSGGISTSGDYQRYYVYEDAVYSHIIDGRTGYPANYSLNYPSKSNIISVSVTCANGAVADALSTSLFVLGYERGVKLLTFYEAGAVFVFDDMTYAVIGIDGFKLNDGAYTEALLKTPR